MDHPVELMRPNEAADQNPLDRPGVPREFDPPQPLASAHWIRPEPQQSEPQPLVGVGRQLTPVYSVANPPRGLSGAVRRLAYRVPDYSPRRWALLILSDKIDVLEHNPARLAKLLLSGGLLGASLYATRRLFRSR